MFKKFYKSAFDSIEPPKELLNELLSCAENKEKRENFSVSEEIGKSKRIRLKNVYKYSACIAAVIAAAMLVTAIPLLKISDNDNLVGYKEQKSEKLQSGSKKEGENHFNEDMTDKSGPEENASQNAAVAQENVQKNSAADKNKAAGSAQKAGTSAKGNEKTSDEISRSDKNESELKSDMSDVSEVSKALKAVEDAKPQNGADSVVTAYSMDSSSDGGDKESKKMADDEVSVHSDSDFRSGGSGRNYGKEVSVNEICDILGISIEDISLPDGVSCPDKIFVQTDSEGKLLKESCGIYFSGDSKSCGIYYETALSDDFSAPSGEYVRKNIMKNGNLLTIECFGFTKEEVEKLFKSIQKER